MPPPPRWRSLGSELPPHWRNLGSERTPCADQGEASSRALTKSGLGQQRTTGPESSSEDGTFRTRQAQGLGQEGGEGTGPSDITDDVWFVVEVSSRHGLSHVCPSPGLLGGRLFLLPEA